MIVCLAQAQLQRAQLVLYTYECHLNERLERRRLRRRRADSNKNSFRAACGPGSRSTFNNLEMAHIKFDSSMQK